MFTLLLFLASISFLFVSFLRILIFFRKPPLSFLILFFCSTVCLVFSSLLLLCFASLFANLSFYLLILFLVFVFIRLLLPRFIFTSLLPFFSFVFLTFISYLFFCNLFSPLSNSPFVYLFIRHSFLFSLYIHSPFIPFSTPYTHTFPPYPPHYRHLTNINWQ